MPGIYLLFPLGLVSPEPPPFAGFELLAKEGVAVSVFCVPGDGVALDAVAVRLPNRLGKEGLVAFPAFHLSKRGVPAVAAEFCPSTSDEVPAVFPI